MKAGDISVAYLVPVGFGRERTNSDPSRSKNWLNKFRHLCFERPRDLRYRVMEESRRFGISEDSCYLASLKIPSLRKKRYHDVLMACRHNRTKNSSET
jgi:hypothetical protein